MKASDLIVGGELILSGTVLDDEWISWMYDDEVFFAPRLVREALQMMGEGPVTVRMNSIGGHVYAGEQVRAILAGHPGGTTIIVEGMAASAASLILMAGTTRQMSSGSLLMIHDPSGMAWGTEEEMRREADALDRAANVYAAVYASASGQTPEAVRQIMKAETWYSPEEAVAAGFVDSIVGAEDDAAPLAVIASMEVGRNLYMAATKHFRAMHARKPRGAATPDQTQAPNPAGGGAAPAMTATPSETEITMNNPTPTPSAVTPATPPAPAPAPVMVTPDPVAQERARVRGIREMAAPFVASGRLMQADVDALIDDGTAVEAASAIILAKMAAAEPVGRSARIIRDETDTRREGMAGALVAQMSGAREANGPAAAFMPMGLIDMAAECIGHRGPVRGVAGETRILEMALGSHSVSDFPAIFENALNRRLLDAYRAAQPTYRRIATRMDFVDFRPHPVSSVGAFPTLLPINETGEIKFGSTTDKKETVALGSYGRGFTISRQMMVNDQLTAIDRVLVSRAQAVAAFEDALFYQMMLSGANSDGPSLLETSRQVFNTTDATKAASGSAISITSLSEGRAAMRRRKSLGKDAADKLELETTPSILLVGPDNETLAQQHVAQNQPQQAGNVNPFSGTLEIVTSNKITGNAWYLFAEPAAVPVFMYGYLEGEAGPRMRMDEPFGTQGVSWTVELDFGVGAIDYRGAYKNAGG